MLVGYARVSTQDHLARFLADVVENLDLWAFYARYGNRGAASYAPEILLARDGTAESGPHQPRR